MPAVLLAGSHERHRLLNAAVRAPAGSHKRLNVDSASTSPDKGLTGGLSPPGTPTQPAESPGNGPPSHDERLDESLPMQQRIVAAIMHLSSQHSAGVCDPVAFRV